MFYRKLCGDIVAMEMTEAQQKHVRDIVESMQCPKDFACYRSGFKNLPKNEVIGNGKLIDCLEEHQHTCALRIPFGHGGFCTCPLRHYIARNFGI